MKSKTNTVTKSELFPEMIQTVTLTFADGTEATFTGPAVLFEGTKKVTDISFGEPKEMPDGCSWGEAK
jgi:hypothetical protein